jgi:hypothetical protein|tara:strand:+ start:78 stop:1724 length:1647 start_codon:yes stop_codon:yes gene_type:complete
MEESEDNISMHADSKGIWNLVNVLGQAVPIEMALRELVQNGFEACQRSRTNFNKSVRVNRDLEGNITITNRGGDFFSLDAAKTNLNTLGNSGNSPNVADNFGIGAKISVLANNHEIRYTSKKENENNGHSFTIGSIRSKDYGLKDLNSSSTFSAKDFPNSFTSASIISEFGNTWDTFNKAVSSKNGLSGWGIANFLTQRYFKTPRQIKLDVAIYNKKGKSKYVPINGALHCMKTTQRYGKFELVGNNIPAGTIAHWCILNEKRTARNKMLTDYFLGFSLKNELLTNLDDSFQSRTMDFTKCGVYSNAHRIVVVFELPESSDFVWHADRSVILSHAPKKSIKRGDFYAAFRKQVPDKIQELQKEEEYEFDFDKIRKEFMKDLNDFYMCSHGALSTSSSCKSGSGNGTTRSSSTSGQKFKFSLNKIPKLIDSNNKDAPIVSFLVDSDSIVVNHESPTFKLRRDKIVNNGNKDYSLISDKEINGAIRAEIYRGAVYSMAEFFMVEGRNYTSEQVEEFLTSDKLDCWGMTSNRAVRVYLGHRLTRIINSLDT